jgi:hypothetical protein
MQQELHLRGCLWQRLPLQSLQERQKMKVLLPHPQQQQQEHRHQQ